MLRGLKMVCIHYNEKTAVLLFQSAARGHQCATKDYKTPQPICTLNRPSIALQKMVTLPTHGKMYNVQYGSYIKDVCMTSKFT